MNIAALASIVVLLLGANTNADLSQGLANSPEEALKTRFKTVVGSPETQDDLRASFPNTLADVRRADGDELRSLEAALRHSEPSQLDRHGHAGIPVYFLSTYKVLGTLGDWELSENGKPCIFVEPRECLNRPLEEVLIHELAHNSEYRMGYDPHNPGAWKLAKRLGWRWSFNPRTGQSAWLMSSNERPDWYYCWDDTSGGWFRCTKDMTPVNGDGEKVRSRQLAFRPTTAEVRERAVVRPPTAYFVSPVEMFAEAIRLFRTSARSRRALYLSDPDLYALVKDHDQREIDKTYGAGTYIRSAGGTLARVTPDTLTAVEQFEQQTQHLALDSEGHM